MDNQRQWKALLYVKEEITGTEERELCEALNRRNSEETEDNEVTILCFSALRTVQELLGKLAEADVTPEECLMIAGSRETLALAKSCPMAVVAYAPPGSSGKFYEGEPVVVEGFGEVDCRYLRRCYERYHGIPWTIAYTKRCIIRELAIPDVSALFALYAKPGVTTYLESLYPWEKEIEYQKEYIAKIYQYYELGMWLVFDRQSGRLIGRAGLEPRVYPGMESAIELGYIIDPELWRRGYAEEVCRRLIEVAQSDYEIDCLHCLITPDNVPSQKLAEKLDFQNIGKMHMDGEDFLHYILQIK